LEKGKEGPRFKKGHIIVLDNFQKREKKTIELEDEKK